MWGWRHRLILRVALLCALSLCAQATLSTPTASAAGPVVAFTDPAPGSTVLATTRFRLGWTESAAPTVPIVRRKIAQFSAPAPRTPTGYCASRRFAVDWTDASANPPSRFAVGTFAPLACYYWIVTVTDVNGGVKSARSGYVLGLPAGDPGVSVTSPAPGGSTDAPPSTFALTWTERATGGVRLRIVTEQSAPAPVGRTCAGATWSTTRTFTPTRPSLALTDLADGTCYRWIVAVWGAGGGSASATSGPLLVTTIPPPCDYGDVPTTARSYGDWSRTLVDSIYRLGSTYHPPDLVSTKGIPYVSGGHLLRRLAYADLKAMAAAARDAGAPIDVTSTFRSYVAQEVVYAYYVKALGPAGGLLRAARPGHSEHGLGTTIDVTGYDGVSPSNFTDWTVSQAGAWMRDNAWRYGWLMSYPKESSPAITCYQYEPWHYRYVGRALAAAVHESGLTLREYLWRHGSIATGS
jgi:zinc D-Ala-D-Ala carboxypeptidase